MVVQHDFLGCGHGADEGVRVRVGEGGGVVDVEVGLIAGVGGSGVGVEWEEGLLVRSFAGDSECFGDWKCGLGILNL